MPNKTIEITGVKANGDLILSDNGTTVVRTSWAFRHLTWEIGNSRIKFIKLRGKTNYNPFEDTIPTTYEKKIKLTVDRNQTPNDWKYWIDWKDKDGNEHHFDPKISIDPNRKDSLLFWIIGAATFAVSLFGLMQVLGKRK